MDKLNSTHSPVLSPGVGKPFAHTILRAPETLQE